MPKAKRFDRWANITRKILIICILGAGLVLMVLASLAIGKSIVVGLQSQSLQPAQSKPSQPQPSQPQSAQSSLDLVSVLLAAAAVYLAVMSLLVTTAPIIGWRILERMIHDWIEKETAKRLERTEKDARGRSFAILGYILGENCMADDFSVVNEERLREAIFHCETAHKELKDTDQPAEFMNLINLLEFYCSLPAKEVNVRFVLQQARRLLEAAQQHDAPNPILTCIRTIFTFSPDDKEKAHVCSLFEEVRHHKKLKEGKQQREVKLIASLCESHKSKQAMKGPQTEVGVIKELLRQLWSRFSSSAKS